MAEDTEFGEKKYGVEGSKKRQHIQNKIIVGYENGIATYSCPERHRGIPKETVMTGDRKAIRKHIMKEHKTW